MLHQVLGDGVSQKGSLVDESKARFDFSHTKAMTPQECQKVEEPRMNSAPSPTLTQAGLPILTFAPTLALTPAPNPSPSRTPSPHLHP